MGCLQIRWWITNAAPTPQVSCAGCLCMHLLLWHSISLRCSMLYLSQAARDSCLCGPQCNTWLSVAPCYRAATCGSTSSKKCCGVAELCQVGGIQGDTCCLAGKHAALDFTTFRGHQLTCWDPNCGCDRPRLCPAKLACRCRQMERQPERMLRWQHIPRSVVAAV